MYNFFCSPPYSINFIKMKKGLAILLSTVLLLSLSGCKLTNFFKSEKDRFIGATSEALCVIFTSENPMAPTPETSDKVKAIYSNYGFDAEDQTGMEAITKNYENDEEVKNVTAKALQECSGIDVTSPAPAEVSADAAPTDEAPAVEEAPAEQPVK